VTARRGIAVLALALALALVAPARAERALERYVLAVEGQRIGRAQREWRTSASGRTFRETASLDVGAGSRRTRVAWSLSVRRDATGAVRRIEYRNRLGAVTNHWRGRVDGAALHVGWVLPTHYVDQTIALPAGVVYPDERAERLREAAGRGARELVELDPLRFVRRVALASVAEPDGSTRVVVRSDEPGADPEHVAFDAGRAVRHDVPFLGGRLAWTPCAGPCPPVDGTLAAPTSRFVVESPYRIPDDALAGPIRLVLRRTDGAALVLPQTDEQSVARDGPRTVVTVCARCGDEPAPSAAELERYRAPNLWVQSDAAEIRTFAARATGRSVHARSAKLAALVRRHVDGRLVSLGYADALQTLRSRDGDCTEFAVLLAAALRARGIPARVAFGLVYSSRFSGRRDVFSPHAWVQAWDGARWRSYDAALEGFDATHVVVALGSGDPDEVATALLQLAHVEIERLGRVASPAAAASRE
jgi:hypothetical protein